MPSTRIGSILRHGWCGDPIFEVYIDSLSEYLTITEVHPKHYDGGVEELVFENKDAVIALRNILNAHLKRLDPKSVTIPEQFKLELPSLEFGTQLPLIMEV